jgi:tetratricopeptide (TPR) repeat protein
MLEHYHQALWFLQVGFTLLMLIDAFRRSEGYWPWIILFVPMLGAWGYFFVVMLPRWTGGRGLSLPSFRRAASLDELRYRAEESPTLANHLELAQRLVEREEFAEATPHLDEVLARESEHCTALFLHAKCHAGQGQLDKAIPCLEKLIGRERYWSSYAAWYELIELRGQSGDAGGAAETCRELARLSPTLRHQCLLAERLLDAEQPGEARQVLTAALREYQYATTNYRWRNWRLASQARGLLRHIDEADGQAGSR